MDRNLTLTVRNVPIDVALRKESVDRNVIGFIAKNANSMSLSARRAWIEIFLLVLVLGIPTVALRKESVDRNSPIR